MLYSLSEDRQQTVATIPSTTSKELEARQREDELDYFGHADLSGLQSSRRRASTSSLLLPAPAADPLPEDPCSQTDSEDLLRRKTRRTRSSTLDPLANTQPSSPGDLESDSFGESRRRSGVSCKRLSLSSLGRQRA